VLVLCVGRATRLARFLSAADKEYRARVRLGFATSTDDPTGDPLGEALPVDVSDAALRGALAGLVGSFDQVPPAFSARQVGGRRLYELARRGEAVARAATPVTVHRLALVERDGDSVELELRCSSGFYVRALARDLGERLGVGAHLSALRRTRSGVFSLAQSVSADDLAGAAARLVPLSGLLLELPAVTIGEEGRRHVGHGRELGAEHVLSDFPAAGVERVRLLDEEGELVALAVPRGLDRREPGLVRPPALHPDIVLIG
jgi:tRNA pseudouridine55 synthase